MPSSLLEAALINSALRTSVTVLILVAIASLVTQFRAEATGRAGALAADSVIAGVFQGRTPCGSIANDFTGFPAANCEKIKWEITLFRDRASDSPKSYQYRGTRSTRSGRWSVRRGAAHDPDANIYQLHYGTDQVLSLMSIGDAVLLLLDSDARVLVGDASWSYVLNRVDSP